MCKTASGGSAANGVVLVVLFLATIPVALALLRWLPRTRSVWVATAMALGAMLAVAVVQLLLIPGVLDFDVAGPAAGGGIPARVRVGVRRQLDRPLRRHSAAIGHAFGLLLGVSFPVGLLIMTSGLHPGFGSPDQLAWFGAVGWLAFLAWPHVLARPGLQQTSIVQLQ
jgi:hypothetical protein